MEPEQLDEWIRAFEEEDRSAQQAWLAATSWHKWFIIATVPVGITWGLSVVLICKHFGWH